MNNYESISSEKKKKGNCRILERFLKHWKCNLFHCSLCMCTCNLVNMIDDVFMFVLYDAFAINCYSLLVCTCEFGIDLQMQSDY